MRKAGILTSKDEAQKLTSAFFAHGIEAQVHEESGNYTFWVVEDDRMDEARSLFSLLASDPENQIFRTKVPVAPKEKPTNLEKKAGMNRARHIDVRHEVFGRANVSGMYVTIFLIVISVLLTAVANMPSAVGFVRSLYFSEYMGRSFPEILGGQVWRIITPIFLHGGFLHLLFNMMWLYQLGGTIERLEKSWYLTALIFGLAALCNTAQYLVSGPLFIGMSGVVYGLLGYVWLMSMYQPRGQYFISQGTITFMMIWLVVCLVGIIPNVANTQHVAGMVLGSAWGWIRAKTAR
jgi:GlpG protein